jgi:hypothetical protein
MTAPSLAWQIIWRSALRILALGALFGAIYGPLVLGILLFVQGIQQGVHAATEAPMQLLGFILFAVVVGAIVGATLGFIVGILLGLLISTITIRAFLPLHDAPRYRQIVQWSSTLVGGIGTLIGAPLVSVVLFGPAAVTKEIGMLAVFSVIPALLACLAVWRGSGQVAKRYVRTTTATAPAVDRKVPLSS